MVTETRPKERIPLYLASIALGLAIGLLLAFGGAATHAAPTTSALFAVLPFALAALTGVAKSATP